MADGAESSEVVKEQRRRLPVELLVFLAIGVIGFLVWRFFLHEAPRPNFVLISIDSLRPDHLGCYGYPRPTSPAIDALAARGTRFEVARSSTSWTLPAHQALMTGLPNDVHDVVYDAIALDSRRQTLAQCFHDDGYRTGGFFGGPYLHPFFGFDRGFDVYENCGTKSIVDFDISSLNAEQLMALNARLDKESHESRTAPALETAAERFLDANGDRPFFLFVHHWDVHYDYIAPAEYNRMFITAQMEPVDATNFGYSEAINKDLRPAQIDYIKALYDAEIRWVDDHIAKLTKALEDRDLADRTYIVITADHGEEFFEHGEKGHRNNLYEETLRIPLIVIGPGVEKGRTIKAGVRIIDIMPTLVDLAGLPEPRDAMGASLTPFLRGEAPGALSDLPFTAELTYIPRDPVKFRKLQAFGKGCFEIISDQWRLYDIKRQAVFSGQPLGETKFSIYDICQDPGQQVERSGSDPQLFEKLTELRTRLRAGLRNMKEAIPHSGDKNIRDVPKALRDQLQQNGYLQVEAPNDDEPAAPPADPTAPGKERK